MVNQVNIRRSPVVTLKLILSYPTSQQILEVLVVLGLTRVFLLLLLLGVVGVLGFLRVLSRISSRSSCDLGHSRNLRGSCRFPRAPRIPKTIFLYIGRIPNMKTTARSRLFDVLSTGFGCHVTPSSGQRLK